MNLNKNYKTKTVQTGKKTNLKYWNVLLVVVLLLPLAGNVLLAQENSGNEGKAENIEVSAEDSVRQEKTARFLNRIQTELEISESELAKINNSAVSSEENIKNSQEKILTLSEQLDSLESQIKFAAGQIDIVQSQIDRKKSELETLNYQLEQKKNEISFQKQMLTEYLQVIFKDRNNFTDLGNESELNTLKLLLSDQGTSENLRNLKYSEILENQGRTIFEKLSELIDEEELNRKLLQVKQYTLQKLELKLQEDKKALDSAKEAKASLLEQTKGEEKMYQQLLEKSKQEQQDVATQIDTLRKNMTFVRERMKVLGDSFNIDDYKSLLEINNSSNLSSYLNGSEGDNAEFAPRWPVYPARGVSAYYREASYVKVFGMQHNAVDIPTAQGTPIKAPADGFVYKAKDNGYGYSYIMLAHANGYMTLYGHVSAFYVSEGDEIKAGDVIGLSGATPGTRGAGLYTTGPHLHFEVLHNGEHEDPLNYLNLAYLNFDSLPEKYLTKALGDRKKVKRQVKVRVNKSGDLTNGDASSEAAKLLPNGSWDGLSVLSGASEESSVGNK